MNQNTKQRCWRFSLRSLIVSVAVLAVLFAATLSPGRPRVMFRFREADGGTAVYARSFGWPVPYLRVPSGDHSGKIPADLFFPGLVVDVAVAGLLVAAAWYASRAIARRQVSRSCSSPSPSR